MKKIVGSLLLVALVCVFSTEIMAAKKKVVKKKVVTKTVSKRPVFPVAGKKVVNPAPVKPLGKAVELGTPVPAAPPAPPVPPMMRSGWSVEGGLGGGALLIEGVYQKGFNDKTAARFGVGYGLGNKYGVMAVDAGACYDLGPFQIGGGLNYAAYSELVKDIPGMSGTLSSKNLAGVEIFGLKRINDKVSARLGYSTSLGLRAAAAYEF